MEGLTRLVEESMARHGFEPPVDHRRLQWSRWFRCETSFNLLLVPSKPGLFALGEEIITPDGMPGGKRMLAVFEVAEADDLPIAISRLFAPASSLRDLIDNGRVFARYTVIDDETNRHSAHEAFQRWLASSAGTASGVTGELGQTIQVAQNERDIEAQSEELMPPAPFPAGF
ncbi:MAG: hypothetical protein DMG70_07355 [Acidobacteria bacterium]|nr:MAG: hypothetical protein DMG70_07355 [Acidobacteriota bacterium]PYY08739.1 MAG: hypothetical protein DMG69_13515 [Acidobacteriota bacterium]